MKEIERNPNPFLFCILGVLLFQGAAKAQDEAVAAATQKGVFIYLSDRIPKQSYYEVELKTGRDKYTRVAIIKAPEDQQAMESRIKEHEVYFENLEPLSDVEKEKLWNYVRASSSIDSLYIPNLPLLHLAAGTAYLDQQETSTGKEYQYRVTLYRSDGTRLQQRETNKVTMPARPNMLKPEFKGKRESARQLLLEWYVPEQRQLSSYSVYRRVFGQGDFQKANVIKGFNRHEDSIFLIVIDTAIRKPAVYEYYLLPSDAYGNPGPPSETLAAGTIGDKYIPVVEDLRGRSGEGDHQVIISWKFENRKYLRSIELYRSMSYDSGFVRIATLPPADSSYLDYLPLASENYYYYLVLNGPFGKSYPSAKISVLYRDTNVPEPPAEVAAETIDHGVRIHWVYEEPFVKGFFVFRSESPDNNFELISPLVLNIGQVMSYTDTSRALVGNQSYYYSVQAISDSDNTGLRSTPASATPGVKTRISPPRNVKIQWQYETVLLSWDDLSETEPDLMGYAVYRREDEHEFQLIFEQDDGRTTNYYADPNVEAGKSYQYAVRSRDFFGAESSLSNIATIEVPVARPAAPSGVIVSQTQHGIHVAWGHVSDPNLSRLLLFRQEVGQKPIRIAAFDTDQLDYLDNTAVRGKLYSYFLISVGSGNTESAPGQSSTIRY